jgi:LPXTG-site transpeptidase (sortase) family protein
MTAIDSQVEEAEVAPASADAEAKPRTRGSQARPRRIIAIALVALAAVLLAWGAFQVFEGPVANTWYTIRQHQLTSDYQGAHAHAGAGKAIAVLQVPRLGVSRIVAEGDSPQQLRSGPGHRIGTPLPGDLGNSVIVGHRRAWGGPLRDLPAVKTGDDIVVQTTASDGSARNAFFTVQGVHTVDSSDTALFQPSNDYRLTLVTGAPSSTDRMLVVTAISGTPGKVLAGTGQEQATTGAGSLHSSALFAALLFLGAAALTWFLRRRYHPAAVAAIVVPIALLGLLALMLTIDSGMSPLR